MRKMFLDGHRVEVLRSLGKRQVFVCASIFGASIGLNLLPPTLRCCFCGSQIPFSLTFIVSIQRNRMFSSDTHVALKLVSQEEKIGGCEARGEAILAARRDCKDSLGTSQPQSWVYFLPPHFFFSFDSIFLSSLDSSIVMRVVSGYLPGYAYIQNQFCCQKVGGAVKERNTHDNYRQH